MWEAREMRIEGLRDLHDRALRKEQLFAQMLDFLYPKGGPDSTARLALALHIRAYVRRRDLQRELRGMGVTL